MAIQGDDKSANRYGFHSTTGSDKPVINPEMVMGIVSRLTKLYESTSKASSLNPDNVDNKAAVEALKTCISECNRALTTPTENMKNTVEEPAETRNTFGL